MVFEPGHMAGGRALLQEVLELVRASRHRFELLSHNEQKLKGPFLGSSSIAAHLQPRIYSYGARLLEESVKDFDCGRAIEDRPPWIFPLFGSHGIRSAQVVLL